MPVPSKADIDKKAKALQDHLKKLNPDGSIKESTAMSMVRSAIRQVWMRAPNKLAVLEQARIPDMNPATRTKWLFECAICKGKFKATDVEVDHKRGNQKFTKPEDFLSFWDNILNVPASGLQVLCCEDHSVKTYQESVGCTWEEAVALKKVIKKESLKVPAQKKELTSFGYKPSQISNKEKRRKCWLELNEKGLLN